MNSQWNWWEKNQKYLSKNIAQIILISSFFFSLQTNLTGFSTFCQNLSKYLRIPPLAVIATICSTSSIRELNCFKGITHSHVFWRKKTLFILQDNLFLLKQMRVFFLNCFKFYRTGGWILRVCSQVDRYLSRPPHRVCHSVLHAP